MLPLSRSQDGRTTNQIGDVSPQSIFSFIGWIAVPSEPIYHVKFAFPNFDVLFHHQNFVLLNSTVPHNSTKHTSIK